MPVIPCDVQGCNYTTADVIDGAAVVQLTHHIATAHPVVPAVAASTKKPDRPTLLEEVSGSEYDLFRFQWRRYKTHAPMNEEKTRNELLECCSKKLLARLYQMSGNILDTINEDDLLAKMKELAVQKVHVIVHRQEFYLLKQDEGEPVAKFVAHLKSKATMCDYNTVLVEAKQQGDKVTYQDNMVELQMIAGIYNPDHKVRILTDADKLPTFADKYNALVTMQMSETSAAQLVGGGSTS